MKFTKENVIRGLIAGFLAIITAVMVVVVAEYFLKDHVEFDWSLRGIIFCITGAVTTAVYDKMLEDED